MQHFPTTKDLSNLGVTIATDGFASHEPLVAEIVAYGNSIEPSTALVVLGDRSEPEVVRGRALAVVSARWDAIAAIYQRQYDEFDAALAEFLAAWDTHEALRSVGDIERLATSATRLQSLRVRAKQARAALAA